MESLVSQEIIVLIVGAVIGGVGSWIAASKADRVQRRTRADEALLKWLNVQDATIRKLVTLARKATGEPDSAAALEGLMSELSSLEGQLSSLIEAMNERMIYGSAERTRWWPWPSELERATRHTDVLVQFVRSVISHHGTHLKFQETIGRGRHLVQTLGTTEAGESEEKQTERLAAHSKAVALTRECEEHLQTCGSGLVNQAKELVGYCDSALEANATVRRKLLRE